MTFIIQSAHSPVRKSGTTIDLMVKFSKFPEEIPFTACPDDTEEHGRILYANAVNGDYGDVIDQQGE